jgi:hypothetical protein
MYNKQLEATEKLQTTNNRILSQNTQSGQKHSHNSTRSNSIPKEKKKRNNHWEKK